MMGSYVFLALCHTMLLSINFICVYFTSCRKVYVFLQKTVAMLARGNPELGLKLYFQIANSADRCALAANMSGSKEGPEFSAVTYEIMAQAFLLYEDEVSDSKAQQRGIIGMVGNLMACRILEHYYYEVLITKTAQYAAKLLKNSDQCKMVTLCLNLFFIQEEDVILPLQYQFIARIQRRAPILFARRNVYRTSLTTIFSTYLPLYARVCMYYK